MVNKLDLNTMWLPTLLILFIAFTSAGADTLVLKDGQVLQGTFKGGTASALKFEVDGTIQEVALSDITSLTFSPRQAQRAVAEPTAPAGAAAGAAMSTSEGPVTVPAGTRLMVKLDKAVSTASHQAGSTITAVLDIDLVVDGKVVAPRAANFTGKYWNLWGEGELAPKKSCCNLPI